MIFCLQYNKLASVENTPWDPSTTNGAVSHWPLTGSLVTHDPTLAYEDGRWWIFQTGPGIAGKCSDNGVPKLLISTLNWDSNG